MEKSLLGKTHSFSCTVWVMGRNKMPLLVCADNITTGDEAPIHNWGELIQMNANKEPLLVKID